MGWRLNVGLGFAVFGYLLLGGTVFHFLESSEEHAIRIETDQFMERFLVDHECLAEKDLMVFAKVIIEAYDAGFIVSNASHPSNWDFASAVHFSMTVITTVGYGNIAPMTAEGRVFFTLYAIIGIPLCLVFLAGIGSEIKDLTIKLDQKLRVCRKRPIVEKCIRFVGITVAGCVLLMLIPAAIIMYFEEWAYGETLYFVVVSLSTVGFGDFVAGQMKDFRGRGIYRICVVIWLFIGLAWLAGLISLIQEFMANAVTKASEEAKKRKVDNRTPKSSDARISGENEHVVDNDNILEMSRAADADETTSM